MLLGVMCAHSSHENAPQPCPHPGWSTWPPLGRSCLPLWSCRSLAPPSQPSARMCTVSLQPAQPGPEWSRWLMGRWGPGSDTDTRMDVNRTAFCRVPVEELAEPRALNHVLPKDISQTPRPRNVFLFGNRVFADVIVMRSYWSRVGPKSNRWCSYRKRHRSTQEKTPHNNQGRD
jgi:hypothetical protein